MKFSIFIARLSVVGSVAVLLSLGTAPAYAANDTPCNQAITLSPNPQDSIKFSGTLFNNEVTTPGSSNSCSVTIKNGGATEANIALTIVNVNPSNDQEWNNDFSVFWETPVTDKTISNIAELSAYSSKTISEFSLPAGDDVSVSIGYSIDLNSTSGRRSDASITKTSFDLIVTAYGDDMPLGETKDILKENSLNTVGPLDNLNDSNGQEVTNNDQAFAEAVPADTFTITPTMVAASSVLALSAFAALIWLVLIPLYKRKSKIKLP